MSEPAVVALVPRLADTVHLTTNREPLTPFSPFEAVRMPFGPFHFKSRLPQDCSYSVEACTDLKNWQQISTGGSQGQLIHFIDSEAHKFACRFYRLRSAGVFSKTVIGYASVGLPPGYSMICNPFLGNQSVNDMFPQWPNGTQLSRFDATLFKLVENRIQKGKWIHPDARLTPGEGALLFNPSTDYKIATLVGELTEGKRSIPVPSGFCICGSILPLSGALDELQFPLEDGDVIHRFDRERQKYVLHPFENGAWSKGPAIIGVGEAFWVVKSKPATWAVNLNLFDPTV